MIRQRFASYRNHIVIRVDKTCARCGTKFGAVGREYVCEPCRRPKSRKQVTTVSRELSTRERQIVALLREAKTNKEIAGALLLTEGTVKEYLWHIFRKLGVKNRTELALRPDSELIYDYLPPRFQADGMLPKHRQAVERPKSSEV
jgi:DNA-binding CsgD family transcriptional regulator